MMRPRRPAATAVLTAALALLLGACSWVGMNKVPGNWQPQSPARCTSSNLPPIADIAMGAFVMAGAVVYGTSVAGECEAECEPQYLLTGAIAIAAFVQWFAATDGFQYAAKCRDAKRKRAKFKRGY